MVATVQILLATFNGENFLDEQLASLFAQTQQDFEILAADDGSTDGTVALLDRWAQRHSGRLHLLFTDRVGGPVRNFMRLVAESKARYAMFCDQDDVWMAEKLSTQLAVMQEMEARCPGLPLLIHTDLRVVDAELRVLAESFVASQHLDPVNNRLRDLLFQNTVTGCTAMLNAALVKQVVAAEVSDVVMHDWWCALVACAFGRIHYVNTPTVLYRQHGENTVGATVPYLGHFARRAWAIVNGGPVSQVLAAC